MTENENDHPQKASDSSEEKRGSEIIDVSAAEENQDFYAVREPEARVYPSGLNSGGDSSAADSSVKEKEAGEVSLESIYSRRREKDRFQGDDGDEIEIPDSPELPDHPFRTKILRPFFHPGFILKFALLASSLWVLFIPAAYFFNRLSRDRIKFEKSVDPSGDETFLVSAPELTDSLSRAEQFLLTPKGEVLTGAFGRYGYLFAVAVLIWGFVTVPFLLQTFVQTASGDDSISDWPQWSQMAGIGQLLWLLLLIVIAGVPGYFILAPVGLARLGFGFGFLLLFPVCFLSSMETDSIFNLLSKNILRSFKIAPKTWRDYYLFSFLSATVVCLLLFLGVGNGLWNEKGGIGFWGLTATAAVLTTFYSLFYFRFLGRLAWTVQGRTERYSEEKRENESAKREKNDGVDGNA